MVLNALGGYVLNPGTLYDNSGWDEHCEHRPCGVREGVVPLPALSSAGAVEWQNAPIAQVCSGTG
jgi:hypothetical protein